VILEGRKPHLNKAATAATTTSQDVTQDKKVQPSTLVVATNDCHTYPTKLILPISNPSSETVGSVAAQMSVSGPNDDEAKAKATRRN